MLFSIFDYIKDVNTAWAHLQYSHDLEKYELSNTSLPPYII